MRNIIRLFKGAGILNILGMTVAFAAIYIILVQVNYDWNYNSNIKDRDRIFTITHRNGLDENKYDLYNSRPNMETLMKQSSMVESYAVIMPLQKTSINISNNDNIEMVELNTMEVTSGAFDLFGVETVAGTFEGIGKENVVAISEKVSQRLNLQLGDMVQLDNEDNKRTVSAIFKNMQINSIFGETDLFYSNRIETFDLENKTEWSYNYFVKLNSAKNKEDFEINSVSVIGKIIEQWWLNTDYSSLDNSDKLKEEYIEKNKITLFSLDKLQFQHKLITSRTFYQCNKTTTITLFIVAILIILITVINFLNFFMAQIPVKLRSVNTKKILGSSRLSLVGSFMAESAILVMISLFFSYIVIRIISNSTYASLISCSLDLGNNMIVTAITVFSALLLVIASSIYPAMHITSFSPAMAMKGTMGTASRGKSFRYTLVGFQFTISIIFILCAFFVKLQYNYMMNYDMGFNKELLFTANVPANQSNRDFFTSELKKRTPIKDVAWGDSPLISTLRMNWGLDLNGKNINFVSYPVSYNFLQFMGIDILEGRDFTPTDEKAEKSIYIFNNTAKEKYGFSLETEIESPNGRTNIAGFCEDFKFKPLHYDVEPFAFYIFGKNAWKFPTHLYIRSNPGATYSEVLQAVKEVTQNIAPDFNTEELDLKFFDEELGTQYSKEQKLISLITLFTILAVVISLMGIIGLLMFETKFRRKEIGLRRVHGASINEILELFNRKFFYILLVSFVIAAPVGYAVMDYYYSSFAYRAPLHWWVFLLSFVIVALVTVAVVTLCSYKAASENPAETLKNE